MLNHVETDQNQVEPSTDLCAEVKRSELLLWVTGKHYDWTSIFFKENLINLQLLRKTTLFFPWQKNIFLFELSSIRYHLPDDQKSPLENNRFIN